MKRKLIYKIDSRKYRIVEVDNNQQAEIIRNLNKDTERNHKKEQRLRKKCTSYEAFSENGQELLKDECTPETILIELEDTEKKIKALMLAISSLKPKYQFVIKQYFFEGKTQKEIALILSIKTSTMSELLKRALEALKEEFFKIFS